MALTTNQKNLIIKKLTTVAKNGCPICQGKDWIIGDEIVSATTVSLGGSTVLGGPYIPMAQLICKKCGFISHHAIGVLGIDLKDE